MRSMIAIFYLLIAAHSIAAESVEPIHVQAFDLPKYSDYISPETRAGIERAVALDEQARKLCDPKTKSTGAEIRACEATMYPPLIAAAREIYDVKMEPHTFGGVYTDVITPTARVAQSRAKRVLINVHGGGFMYGARFAGQLESMPLAAIGGYKVVSVDYRMAPEHHFPAATLDVVAVYKELLKEYDAADIGLYGCSAGGRIVGQTMAWMNEHKLPKPGAIAILCSPPTGMGGDSNVIVAALQGKPPMTRNLTKGYYKGVAPTDRIAFAGDFDETLAHFPPTLLMTSTRDYSLSPMVQMHARLMRLGVPAELHIFEGFRHAEFLSPHVPEAKQAAKTVAAFFDRHLGAK